MSTQNFTRTSPNNNLFSVEHFPQFPRKVFARKHFLIEIIRKLLIAYPVYHLLQSVFIVKNVVSLQFKNVSNIATASDVH